ncbi:MAG TPA: hypothetical protein DDW94_12575 [Deltaproteobacteria bacterium]|nr:MAG: hypothetical protein A2Z79_07200 [Deltaproteobacteria bacterium GWA2_55_82]OIJ73044.1 MAG: hypothetical protein A2V21_301465 [Deltaproteobacteria bacterium GWC2_55_46]HBG47805.1 hypothetical protein [Deltaproteobacteria bacterium]HCY11932.1 hypothetical protein [Deltaproteobacteria bacterium]
MKSRVSIANNLDVETAVWSALDAMEGLSALFIGKHVAIKPNDTWASKDDLTACTQADTLRAVVRYVKNYFPKKLTVSGGAGAGETADVFRLLGLDRVIAEEGVEFFDHNRPPFKAVPLEYGPLKEVMVNERVLDYETVISLAQHKEHHLATVTLTMKNISMSYPAADYYGHPRAKSLHPHDIFTDIQKFIAGMCKTFPIGLGIIVGHPAMTGTGPIGGHTFESGIVIASKDCVAADTVGARILGYDRVEHIIEAERLGVGTANLNNIDLAGVRLDEARRLFRERERQAAA